MYVFLGLVIMLLNEYRLVRKYVMAIGNKTENKQGQKFKFFKNWLNKHFHNELCN